MSEPNQDFSSIAPIGQADFRANMAKMVDEPGLEYAVKYVMPDLDYPAFKQFLLQIPDQQAFLYEVMWPFMERLAKKTTSGVTISGLDNISRDSDYTFITNHRDIVLDASFLNICLFRNGWRPTETAIGSNLLIFPWIATLVKLNGCFIVKRDLPRLQALDAARELSGYIHYAVNEKRQSVWIAQREGRAKDSSDHTQPSLLKMMALGGEGTTAERLASLKLAPVSIAYEYDPNDYLKAREFLMKRRDPEFKKSKRDDLFSMETGLLQFKGRVHFSVSPCLADEIAALSPSLSRNATIDAAAALIDRSIHARYKIYAINYIACDELTGRRSFDMLYTKAEREAFLAYINHQLDKVRIEGGITPEEREWMRAKMFTMYANPLLNKLKALDEINGSHRQTALRPDDSQA